jgi:hypothetical protein
MNRLRNIFACLCPALLLTFGQGHAATVIWSDGFETNTPSRWTATGAWHIGNPTAGPAKNSSGYRTHSGANCATTQNYSYNQDGRIVCTKYLNGSNSLVIPAASASPTLIFWHWVNLANALGYVELKSGTNDWQQISPTYLNVTSGGAWLQNSIDLSAFAGQSVQIGFHFTSGGCCGNAKGWYVDDVSLTVVVTTPPVLTVPDTQTIYAGQTLTVTNSATNSFLPNATYTFKLLSPPSNASITRNGVLTWATTNTQSSGTNTITVKVTDNSTPALSATNSFVVVVVNPWEPVFLTVPDTQTIYAGQPLDVTVSATNTFFPNATFTFTLLSGMTNVDAGFDDSDLPYDGVLSWTTTTVLKAGTYTNVIKVTDNNSPYYSATNSFEIVVSKPPPPVLTVPTQTIYLGQTLDVFLSATNSVFPDATYTYETNSAPAGALIVLDPETGESSFTWTPTNAPSVKTITVTVMEDNSLSATNSFQVIVSPTPPPALIIPDPQPQAIHAGQTLAVTITATNVVLTNSMFTFRLQSPSTNVSIITSNNIGVLTWTNTGICNGILTWTNNSVSPGNKTINLIVTATNPPVMSATNSFVFSFLPPLPPTLTVPTNQTIYVGQMFTVTNFATNTNVFLTNAIYTFKLPSPSTNVWITTNGVLTWTNTAVPPGTNLVSVKVTDNSVTPLSATNSFKVIVTPFPPVLTNLLAGSHSFQFSFHTLSNTTWRIDAATNLDAATNWLPIFTNTAGTSGTLQFTDLLATNYLRRFYRAALQ